MASKNESFNTWRNWTVGIVYFELAISSVGLATGILLIFTQASPYADGVDPLLISDWTVPEKRNAILLGIGTDLLLNLLIVFSILSMWSTTKFLTARKQCSAKDALNIANSNKTMNKAIIVSTLIALLINGSAINIIMGVVVWYVNGFFWGQRFTRELEMVAVEEEVGEEIGEEIRKEEKNKNPNLAVDIKTIGPEIDSRRARRLKLIDELT